MANPDHVAKLKEGVEAWNQWRKEDNRLQPDLSGLELTEERFLGVNFRNTNFCKIKLAHVEFLDCDFSSARFCGAEFEQVDFNRTDSSAEKVDLTHAKFLNIDANNLSFKNSDLTLADFSGYCRGLGFSNSILRKTNLLSVRLLESGFGNCYMQEAKLNPQCELVRFQKVDLSKAIFESSAYLLDTEFYDSNLTEAVFRGIEFDSTSFNNCNFSGVDFTNAKLAGIEHLEKPSFRDAIFRDAHFLREDGSCNTDPAKIDFRGADLRGVDFKGQGVKNLSSAKLAETNLSGVDLSGLDLIGADLSGAKLENTNLKDTKLYDANLSGADVRKSIGLILDSNYIRDTRFASNASDPWSILRRRYTGANFILNLLLLSIFVIPLVAKTIFWSVVNSTQNALAESAVALETNCLSAECRDFPVLGLVLGFDQSIIYGCFASTLLLYNFLRGVLTWFVGPLRDEEERSNYAPALRSYQWLRYLDKVTQWLVLGVVVFFFVFTLPQILSLLFSSVSLPVNR